MSDLIATNVSIKWSGTKGTVSGDIHKVTGWKEFSAEETDGHYFPVSLDAKYKSKNITCTGSKPYKAVDTDWVLKVDNCKSFKFEDDTQTEICTLDFNSANLEEE